MKSVLPMHFTPSPVSFSPEQLENRIIRRGNLEPRERHVEVIRPDDPRLQATPEAKARFIEQLSRGSVAPRVEDSAAQTLSSPSLSTKS